jgi:methylated-DNA-[protein]-cysteine S-methyltransferase
VIQPQGFTLFDTPVGSCAVVWGERGLVGVLLPERSESATRARLARRYPRAQDTAAPAAVKRAIERIFELMHGQPDDLRDIELDMSVVPDFHQRVYAITRRILPGNTRTYGEIATELGEPLAARAVGQALGTNPFPIIVPCHRVLAAGGKAGGFSAPGGTRTKLHLLEIEGAPLGGEPGLFDEPARNIKRAGD